MSKRVELTMFVRDYECDLQGVVNNAVYQNYLEHARHEFLMSKELDFAALSKAGINLMVVRAELDYQGSLTSRNSFLVRTEVEQRSKLKFVFIQEIYNLSSDKTVLKAEITGVAVNGKGRPFAPIELTKLFW